MRVLVCDDDPDVGGFLRNLFDLEGWECELVTSGEECLARFVTGSAPEALVLDQVMPGLTGIAVADQVRAEGYVAPIILCSGHLGPELSDEIERLALIPVNKLDLQALVRVVRVAVASPPVVPPRKHPPAKRTKAAKPAKAPARKRTATTPAANRRKAP